MDEEFVAKVTEIVRKHPGLNYSIEIEDSHVPLLSTRNDLINDAFCNVWREYSFALFESIRQLVRYEKSLRAWEQLIVDVDKEVKDTVVMDYVFPTFRLVCDIPITFKDQVIRAVVKLRSIAENDLSPIETNDSKKSKQPDWIPKFNRICKKNPDAKKLYEAVNRDLYESQDAAHFRELHGFATHDSSRNLVSGKPTTTSVFPGLLLFGFEDPLDLAQELEIIDRHRRAIQDVYVMFDEYATKLYESL